MTLDRSGATFATEAVVLRTVPYGEADVIATLLTRDFGKISAMARGARRSRRRFAGVLELFTVSKMQLKTSPRSDMRTLVSGDVAASFAKLAADIGAVAHGSYATELVRELVGAEQPDEPVFSLLLELYESVAAVGPRIPVLRGFELSLLSLVGLQPILDRCVSCEKSAEAAASLGDSYLEWSRGGILCGSCARIPAPAAKLLSPNALRALQIYQHADTLVSLQEQQLDGDQADGDLVRDAVLSVLLAHIGKPLRSLEFIAKIRGAARLGALNGAGISPK